MSLQLKDPSLLKGQLFIDGQWLPADSGETLAVTNPATGETICEVAKGGTDETRRAIEAADKALPAWRALSAKDRAVMLRKLFNLIIENQDDLGRILTAEQGKPLAEAKGEVAYSASFIEWFAEEGKRLYGDVIPAPTGDKRMVVIKQGIGVVAAITPWNFPSAMLGRKLGPALAAGCTVVCKPANATPLSAYAIGVLAERAGIPAGVINIVTGRTSDIGDELTGNPIVKKVTFTGSTPVGKHLMAQCAQTVKRTSMELGGNAPFIVFDDADLDAAVAGAMLSKYRNAGQTCVCANRLMVHENVYDEFVEKLKQSVAQMKMGNGFDEGVTVGPLVDEKAARTVRGFIEEAVEKGATVVAGGNDGGLGGAFLAPTILTNVSDDMRVFREEIFGPVAPVFKFSTDEEAIKMANDTEFGLAAYFYSRDIGRVWRISEALDYGIVGINEGIISTEVAPFGGVKESGNGREGSKYGMDDYTEIKYLCMGGI
jgi:succinate-semialdehyde dehydrogenase/glutarate-semialdehyde dehydrogenase